VLQRSGSYGKSEVLKFRSFWKVVPFVGWLVIFNESLLGYGLLISLVLRYKTLSRPVSLLMNTKVAEAIKKSTTSIFPRVWLDIFSKKIKSYA